MQSFSSAKLPSNVRKRSHLQLQRLCCALSIAVVAFHGDSKTAQATGFRGDLKLYWSGQESTLIHRANLDGTEMEIVLQTAGGTVPDIAFDPVQSKMYWASVEGGGIQRANYDGSEVETVIGTTGVPYNMTIDVVNRKAYWSGSDGITGRHSIWRSDLDGDNRELLVEDIPRVTAVEVDPASGYYYWSEFLHGTINRVTLDNSQSTVIFDRAVFGRTPLPWGIAIDVENGYLYAADLAFQALLRMSLDGSDPEIFLSDGVVDPHAIVVDPYNDRVIWSNQARGPAFPDDTNISSVNFDGTDPRIEFFPIGRFGQDSSVRHLALLAIPVPEPGVWVLIVTLCLVGVVVHHTRSRSCSNRCAMNPTARGAMCE